MVIDLTTAGLDDQQVLWKLAHRDPGKADRWHRGVAYHGVLSSLLL